MIKVGERERNLLSAGTAIFPNVPFPAIPLLGAELSNVRTSDTLVITVVPLSNIFGDLNRGVAVQTLACANAVWLPGKSTIREAEIQQLKGPLGSLVG